jgi:hypothetical protein
MADDDDKPALVHPTWVPDPKRLPSPEAKQVVSIRPGSKLAIVGVFVEILRRRFSGQNVGDDFPWAWRSDASVSKLEIESAFNEDISVKNKRPAIHVDVDDQINSRTVLGDFVGKRITDGLTGFWHLSTVPILIECVASKKVESASIADIASVFLLASNRLIQAKFGFHDMTPTTVGRTQPAPRDKNEFITPITFTVQSNLRYTNLQTAPLLEELEFDIVRSDVESATDYFERVALSRASK